MVRRSFTIPFDDPFAHCSIRLASHRWMEEPGRIFTPREHYQHTQCCQNSTKSRYEPAGVSLFNTDPSIHSTAPRCFYQRRFCNCFSGGMGTARHRTCCPQRKKSSCTLSRHRRRPRHIGYTTSSTSSGPSTARRSLLTTTAPPVLHALTPPPRPHHVCGPDGNNRKVLCIPMCTLWEGNETQHILRRTLGVVRACLFVTVRQTQSPRRSLRGGLPRSPRALPSQHGTCLAWKVAGPARDRTRDESVRYEAGGGPSREDGGDPGRPRHP